MAEADKDSASGAPAKQRLSLDPFKRIRHKGLVTRLAWADMRHEWLLSLCLIFALVAVLAPLIILFGVKQGVIDTMRNRQTQNPIFRQILPQGKPDNSEWTPEWFAELEAREDIEFAVPYTHNLARSLIIRKPGTDDEEDELRVELHATKEGDPLLLENGASIPGADECVLSFLAAKELGVKAGDSIEIIVTKERERVYTTNTVAGVMHFGGTEDGSTATTIYTGLDFLNQVQLFKNGYHVPERNWPGKLYKAIPQFDGVIILPEEPLDEKTLTGLIDRTGFDQVQLVASNAVPETLGFQLTTERSIYLLHVEEGAVGGRNISAVERRFRRTDTRFLPWVKPRKAVLKSSGGGAPVSIQFQGLPMGEKGIAPAEAEMVTWNNEDRIFEILLPEGVVVDDAGLTLSVPCDEGTVDFPVSIATNRVKAGGSAYMPMGTASSLRFGDSVNLAYNPLVSEFLRQDRDYPLWRMHAVDIDQVQGVAEYLESTGLPGLKHRLSDILKVKDYDRHFSNIFTVIAMVAVLGAVFSLIASLYASVERKKRELSVLRLIGLSKGNMSCFPLVQGATLALISLVSAFGIFFALTSMLDQKFSDGQLLREGESFTSMPGNVLMLFFVVTIVVAVGAALLAVWRLARIQPAEALRDE